MTNERYELQKGTEAVAQSEMVDSNKTQRIEQIAEKLLDGATAQDTFGLTDQLMEAIYGQAYRLYNTGKYKEASQLFRLLVTLNPAQAKYTLGLAACFHMAKEYATAVELYSLCGVIDPSSPIPHYHASDCYLEMGDKASAMIALKIAIERAGEKTEFGQLRERAAMTLQGLIEEFDKGK